MHRQLNVILGSNRGFVRLLVCPDSSWLYLFTYDGIAVDTKDLRHPRIVKERTQLMEKACLITFTLTTKRSPIKFRVL
eukprot:6438426-Amphidinium_carterae.1